MSDACPNCKAGRACPNSRSEAGMIDPYGSRSLPQLPDGKGGSFLLSSYSSFLPIPYKAVDNILSSLKTLLTKQRQILELSAEIADEGTNSQMSDYIREQEKLVWMYSAFLNKS